MGPKKKTATAASKRRDKDDVSLFDGASSCKRLFWLTKFILSTRNTDKHRTFLCSFLGNVFFSHSSLSARSHRYRSCGGSRQDTYLGHNRHHIHSHIHINHRIKLKHSRKRYLKDVQKVKCITNNNNNKKA